MKDYEWRPGDKAGIWALVACFECGNDHHATRTEPKVLTEIDFICHECRESNRHSNEIDNLKTAINALHYVNERADRKIAELTEKNSAAIDALKLNERLITKLIEHCDGDLMDLLSEDVAFATNANLKILSRLKTSKQWQAEIYDELVIADPDGWDRIKFEHSFYEQKITQEEFERRLSRSSTLIAKKKAVSDE